MVKDLVQTISIDAGWVRRVEDQNFFSRTNLEHITLVHTSIGSAVDVVKGFKKDFSRGDVKSLVRFLDGISKKVAYADFILPRSNALEAYISTFAAMEGGGVFVVPTPRNYVRNCGIQSGKSCADERAAASRRKGDSLSGRKTILRDVLE